MLMRIIPIYIRDNACYDLFLIRERRNKADRALFEFYHWTTSTALSMNGKKLNRKVHYWGALACAVPIAIVIVTGVLLLLKKDFDWIQPSSENGSGKEPTIHFEQIIPILAQLKEVDVSSWKQIKRIDVRPNKGILKIQLIGDWEVQMDHQTGQVLKVAFRRSGIIESIHDGSFFHDKAKLSLFLPAALILLILWITGIYLFVVTEQAKWRSRKKQQKPRENLSCRKQDVNSKNIINRKTSTNTTLTS
ncbi:MAG: putative iron-regulated membrane protein [Arenicella sp.]|jgi:uncharacterized iron-regulated membrane protein